MTAPALERQKTLGWLGRALPIAGWLPRYQSSWLAGEAIAGFTI